MGLVCRVQVSQKVLIKPVLVSSPAAPTLLSGERSYG